MILLARFIQRGPHQAALVMAVTAILAIILPPVAWLSSGATALVTLRQGHLAGLKVVMIATLGAGFLSWLVLGVPLLVASFVLVMWLPVWLLAVAVGYASMDRAIQWLTLVCLLLVVFLYVFYPAIGEIWRQPLEQMVLEFESRSQGRVSSTALEETKEWLIRLMPGVVASSLFFNSLIGLFLGRWWQAALYNPGGFAAEYNALRLGRALAVISVVVFALTYFVQGDMLTALAIVAAGAWMIQGLAVVQGVLVAKKAHKAWLLVLYVLLIFIPHLALPLVSLGLMDSWFDFRNRVATAV